MPVRRRTAQQTAADQTRRATATTAIQKELQDLTREPVEGCKVKCNEDNLFEWAIAIFGAPGTLYGGGYFKAQMKFPEDYPFSPPVMHFNPPVYHPNVYPDGRLCISILHPHTQDPTTGEAAVEQWSPVRSIRSVLLSVVALLSEPNTDSPANVDAAKAYRIRDRDPEYANKVKEQVEESTRLAAADNVTIPVTLADYMGTGNAPAGPQNNEDDDYNNNNDGDDDHDDDD